MLLKDEVIIIRKIKYVDKTIIIKALSKESGIISLAFSRSKQKRGNDIQPLNIIDINYAKSKQASIYRIRDFSLTYSPYKSPNNQLLCYSIATFIAEVLNKIFRDDGRNHEIYSFLCSQIKLLGQSNVSYSHFHIYFLFDLLTPLGIKPNIQSESEFYESTHSLSKDDYLCFKNLSVEKKHFSTLDRDRTLSTLISYIDQQLDCGLSSIKSQNVLREVFG